LQLLSCKAYYYVNLIFSHVAVYIIILHVALMAAKSRDILEKTWGQFGDTLHKT
jgi:hypothetical protein